MKIRDKNKGLDLFVGAILHGDLKVGEVIRQRDLCDVLGISMSPLRETLILLEELDLIEVKARAGIKIIDPDLRFMRENMQFRIILETHAIDIFFQIVTDEWINRQIKEHQDYRVIFETAEDLTVYNTTFVEFDQQFHRDIVASLSNEAVAKAHERIQTKLRIARRVNKRIPPRQVNIQSIDEHLIILDTLAARDKAGVTRALDAHFTASSHRSMVGY